MDERTVRVNAHDLERFMGDVFVHMGVPEDEARASARVLIRSDLRGIESHGIGRLKMYYDRLKNGQHQAITNFEIIRESPTTAVVDGHHGMGMIIGIKAMNLAIEKARTYGMGSVAVRNSTHFGIDGYYPLMAVDAGMIGMSFTNARPAIAPTFSVQPMLGTNPIAFGCPTDEAFPFLFDGATSIIQRGKVEIADREGKMMEPGYIVDTQNQPMTDPVKVLHDMTRGEAALLPLGGEGEHFAGYKGYDLATMVEILSASLQTGSFLYGLTGIGPNGENQPFKLGHFFMAMDIEAFTDLETFKKTTGDILRELRAARKAPGASRIYTAGEKEYENEKRLVVEGIPIIPTLQKQMRTIMSETGLSGYNFDF